MAKDYPPRRGQRAAAARDSSQSSDPLELLRDAIDAVAADPALSADEAASIAGWVDQITGSGVLRRAPLSPDAIDLIAQVVPPASVTAELQTRLEREQQALRAEMLSAQAIEADCGATSPAELFRDLRERAGLTVEGTAALFGTTPTTWIAVERKQGPWYQLRADALPAFAAAVREPIDRLIALIELTARRALYQGIERRANLALGRFDDTQGVSEARRDTLRLAFARVQEENRGAAAFLETARHAAAGAKREGPGAGTGQHIDNAR